MAFSKKMGDDLVKVKVFEGSHGLDCSCVD